MILSTYEHATLEELIDKVKSGDNDAFNALQENLSTDLQKITKSSMFRHGKDKDEIKADVSYALFEAAINFEFNKDITTKENLSRSTRRLSEYESTKREKPWRKKFFSIYDKDIIEEEYSVNLVYSPQCDQNHLEESDFLEQVLKKRLQGLGLNEKRIFYLRYGLGKRFQDIDKSLELKKGYSSKIISRIIDKIDLNDLDLNRSDPDEIILALNRWFDLDPKNIKDFQRKIPKSIQFYDVQYKRFLNREIKYNPIVNLESENIEIIRNNILESSQSKNSPYQEMLKRGFRTIMTRNSLMSLVKTTVPDLAHKLPYLRKWSKGVESTNLAIKCIQDSLFELPGYKISEETNNRSNQVNIINDFIKREKRLVNYFREYCNGMTSKFIDPTGDNGLKKPDSPKAILEFYSDKQNLSWFDRTYDTYVHKWKITERNMWKNKQDSVELALEAISDVLYTIPGYRLSENKKDRHDQIKLIKDYIFENPYYKKFIKKELAGLFRNFIDKNGEYGFKKHNSIDEMLRFYSKNKELDWFNNTKDPYLQ